MKQKNANFVTTLSVTSSVKECLFTSRVMNCLENGIKQNRTPFHLNIDI